jgi:hypothetical protein
MHDSASFRGKALVDCIKEEYAEVDAFLDAPFHMNYQLLFENFKNSLFILTVRNENSWVESWRKHHYLRAISLDENKSTTRHKRFSFGKKNHWVRNFKTHNEEVTKFMTEEKGNFLVIDVAEKGSPQKVNDFLKCDLKINEFPHENKTSKSVAFLKVLCVGNRDNDYLLDYFLRTKVRKQVMKLNSEAMVIYLNTSKLEGGKLHFNAGNKGTLKLFSIHGVSDENEVFELHSPINSGINYDKYDVVKEEKTYIEYVAKGLSSFFVLNHEIVQRIHHLIFFLEASTWQHFRAEVDQGGVNERFVMEKLL